MGFHKYCPPGRIDIIENARIRFTPANGFNDPFECLPDSRLAEHPAWQRQIEDASVRQLMSEDPRNNEADIRRISRERYQLRLPQIKEMARDLLRAAREPFRILCLCQVQPDAPEALLLWGHYTGDHKGFVITFNHDDPWFAEHTPVPGRPHDSNEVTYSEKRAGWVIKANGQAEPQRAFIFTKSLHWVYEKEFRLVRFKNTAGVDSSTVDALVSFPPSALRSITLGEHMLAETKRRLLAAVSRPQFRHIEVFQAKTDPDEYRLNVTPVRA
jgi:hypothetical protein